jgi:hypothetical protein
MKWRAQALEYQLQLGSFRTRQSPAKAGTLTPVARVLALLLHCEQSSR